MVKKERKPGKKTVEKREAEELKRAINALNSTQHNPIAWGPIIAMVAPIIARIAARYAMRALARRLQRKISTKIRDETVVGAADFVADIAVKRIVK